MGTLWVSVTYTHFMLLHFSDVSEYTSRSFDVVRVKYIKLDSIKCIKYTKFDSSTSPRQTHVVYKVDKAADGNLMSLKLFKALFPKSSLEELHTTKKCHGIKIIQ